VSVSPPSPFSPVLNRPSRNGTIITSSVLGKIDVNCKLSGASFMLLPVRNLHSSRNTRPSSHVDQFTHHLRAVIPCLRSVRTCLPPVSRYRRSLPHRPNRFAQSKALSFVSPNGRFTLMEYRFDPSASKPGAAPALTAAAAAQLQVQVPFTVRATLSITDHGGPFLPPSLSIAYSPN
jgi:AP-3 complex subunit mu